MIVNILLHVSIQHVAGTDTAICCFDLGICKVRSHDASTQSGFTPSCVPSILEGHSGEKEGTNLVNPALAVRQDKLNHESASGDSHWHAYIQML